MKYTKDGLKIDLEEIRKILEYAENQAKYNNMEHCIYIKGGDRPKIMQNCCYSECNLINYTINTKTTERGTLS